MKTKIKLRHIVVTIVVMLLLFSLPLISVWKKSVVFEILKKNNSLKVEMQNKRNKNILLTYKLNKLIKRNCIEKAAKEKYNLKYPLIEDVVFVSDESAGKNIWFKELYNEFLNILN